VALSLASRITVEALFPATAERAVALSPAQRIAVEALFPAAAAAPGAASFPRHAQIRNQAERKHIRAALAAADGIEEAARRLGVGRSTLFDKMRRLDIRTNSGSPPFRASRWDNALPGGPPLVCIPLAPNRPARRVTPAA